MFRFPLFIMLCFLPLLTSCVSLPEPELLDEPSPRQDIPQSDYDIKISVSDQTIERPVKNITVILENKSMHTFEYGNFFYLEKNIDDIWYMLAYEDAVFDNFTTFTNFNSYIGANQTAKQTVEPDYYNLTLNEGEYRFVKSFRNINDESSFWLADEFTVY